MTITVRNLLPYRCFSHELVGEDSQIWHLLSVIFYSEPVNMEGGCPARKVKT